MLYHCLSLFLLAYLAWRRPVAGAIVGALEGMWLLWPLYGLPELLSFNVHLTLALTCLFAWRRNDVFHSIGLALGGAVVLGLPSSLPAAALGRPAAVLMGVLWGELVVTVWVSGRLVHQLHSEDRDAQEPALTRRMLQTLGRLNSPLGTKGDKAVSRPAGHRSAEPSPKHL